MNIKAVFIFLFGVLNFCKAIGQFEFPIMSQPDSIYRIAKVKSREMVQPKANYSFKYDYDTLGRIETYTRFYRSLTISQLSKFYYDVNGKLQSIITKSFIKSDPKDSSNFFFETNSDSSIETKAIYLYRIDGRISKVSYVNSQDSIIKIESFQYNDNSIIRTIARSNRIDSIFSFLTPVSGKEKFISKFYINGKLGGGAMEIFENIYNSYGQLQKQKSISTDLKTSNDYSSQINFIYNESNLIEKCFIKNTYKKRISYSTLINKFTFYK
jgi:hypothetical protein